MWNIKSVLIFGETFFTLSSVFESSFELCIFKLVKVVILNNILTLVAFDKLTPLADKPSFFYLCIVLIHDQFRSHLLKTAIIGVKMQSIFLYPIEIRYYTPVTHSWELLKLLSVIL